MVTINDQKPYFNGPNNKGTLIFWGILREPAPYFDPLFSFWDLGFSNYLMCAKHVEIDTFIAFLDVLFTKKGSKKGKKLMPKI